MLGLGGGPGQAGNNRLQDTGVCQWPRPSHSWTQMSQKPGRITSLRMGSGGHRKTGGGASEGMTELSTHSGLLFWIAESSLKGNSSGSCSDTSLCSHWSHPACIRPKGECLGPSHLHFPLPLASLVGQRMGYNYINWLELHKTSLFNSQTPGFLLCFVFNFQMISLCPAGFLPLPTPTSINFNFLFSTSRF